MSYGGLGRFCKRNEWLGAIFTAPQLRDARDFLTFETKLSTTNARIEPSVNTAHLVLKLYWVLKNYEENSYGPCTLYCTFNVEGLVMPTDLPDEDTFHSPSA